MSASKFIATAVVIPSLLLSAFMAFGTAGFVAPTAKAITVPDGQTCSTLTLASNPASTMTAGWTATDPGSAPAALQATAYSGGSLSAAPATQTVIPPWLDPTTNASFSGSGAVWVSSAATWPGGAGNLEGSPTSSQWRLFSQGFTLPAGATVSSATLAYTADNAATAYLNGAAVGTTGDVYGTTTATNGNFSQVFNATLSPTAGSNTLAFVVRNWGGDYTSNPTGLVYKAVINYCVPTVTPTPTSTVTVSIVKFVDGHMATPSSSNNNLFPMMSTWTAANLNNGTTTSGTFNLGPTGFNSTSSYTAVTADMTSGASYSVHENLGTDLVGPNCTTHKTYDLVGYSWGDSLAQAASSTVHQGPPSFENLTSNKTVVVWNNTCPTGNPTSTPPGTVTVHILKYLDGAQATASSSNGYLFPMMSTWTAANLNNGTTTSGTFNLGSNWGGASALYGADTSPMNVGANYSFNEVTNGTSTQVLPIGATCQQGMYQLQGYRASGTSFADAASSSLATSSPSFTNLQHDEYVIVSNHVCGSGTSTSTDNGQLIVTSIDMIKSTSTADGTFDGGWKYVFHITVPNNEPNLSMKFSDWMQNASSTGSSTIPVANNMRISSNQTTSSSTILLTAANTYSTPPLVVNNDLDPTTPGKQILVTVDVSIPVGTNPGAYSTNYGVRSLP